MSSRMSTPFRTLTTIATVIVVPAAFTGGLGSATAASLGHAVAGRTFIVTTTADTVDADVGTPKCADAHGKCSLRAAIMQANFDVGPDTIKIPAGTYRLTRKGLDDLDVLGDLDIAHSLTLQGAGAAKTIIDGNGKVTGDRVVQVLGTATDVTISGVTIRGGTALDGTFDEGGGLNWAGQGGNKLVMTHVVVTGNQAYYDAGLELNFSNDGDVATLTDLTVQDNHATSAAGGVGVHVGTLGTFLMRDSLVVANRAYEGAGVYLDSNGPSDAKSIQIRHTVVASNQASGLSGGLENHAGYGGKPVLIVGTYFHDNTAKFQGGGIGNYGNLHLNSSTVEANSSGLGGGIYDYEGGLATLTNDTLAANAATTEGGAVYVEFFIHGMADVAFRSSTLSGNSAPTGGGVFVDPAGARASFANTIIAKGTGANCNENLAGLTSLSDDSSCGFGVGDGIANLGLGPIGAHGGFTRTLVPGVGSAALDAGTAAGAPATDQRGITRPMGGGVDVGAVEVCPAAPGLPARVAPLGSAKGPRLTLDWKNVACIQSYSVVIRAGSAKGKIVQSKAGLLTSTFRTKKLAKGTTYFWRVSAIGDRGTTLSGWHRVRLKST